MLSDQKTLKEEKINEFEHGLRPDGSIIGNYRDPEYKDAKYYMNPLAGGHVDLMFTKRTANSLFIKKTHPSSFIFDWNDRYNLVGKYGLDILGINKEYFDQRQKDIYRYTLIYQINKRFQVY